MSTALDVDISALESLDFTISCQATHVRMYFGGKEVAGTCSTPATHTATIHCLITCQWVEKFLCTTHSQSYRDECWECDTAPRIKNCKHLGAS